MKKNIFILLVLFSINTIAQPGKNFLKENYIKIDTTISAFSIAISHL